MRQSSSLKAGSYRQNPGSLALIPGGQYAQRPSSLVTRRHDAPDPDFDKEVRGVYSRWHRNGDPCQAYSSRAIANVAQEISYPGRVIDRHLEDAVMTGVPLDWVKELGRLMMKRVDELAAKHGRLTA